MKLSIASLMLITVVAAATALSFKPLLRKERREDLVKAVELGNIERVEELLKIHDVNERISGLGFLDSNSSLLITAAKSSNVEMVRVLLELGADPAVQDNSGYAAIHFVAQNKTAYGNKSLEQLKRDLVVLNDLVVCTPQLKPTRHGTALSMARYLAFTSKQHQELYRRKIQILEEWMDKTKGDG